MAVSYIPGNYVKFLRGTPTAWAAITNPDKDTLYFIAEAGAATGKLYLGSTLISGGALDSAATLDAISDVLISNDVTDGSLLVYEDGKWVNKTVAEAIAVVIDTMTGASAEADGTSGLVPVPKAGDEALFLRGDATWADPVGDLNSVISTLVGEDADKSVREIVSAEIANMLSNAPEQFDTLAEIAEWVANHEEATDLALLSPKVENIEDILNGKAEVTDEEGNVVTPAEDGLIARVSNLEDLLNNETDGVITRLETVENNYTELSNALKWQDISVSADSE